MKKTVIGSFVERVYLDANAWDFVADHPDRDRLIQYLTTPDKRLVLPSVVNVIELLRSPPARRRVLASALSAFMPSAHVLLADPGDILEEAARSFAGGRASVTMRQDHFTMMLTAMAFDPDRLTAAIDQGLAEGVREHKAAYESFWKSASVEPLTKDPAFAISAEFLARDAPQILEQFYISKKLGLMHAEINSLLKGRPGLPPSAPWVAFAFQWGMAIELVHGNEYSAKKARNLPNGIDMSQLAYLGLVSHFLTEDREFLSAARRVAQLVSATTPHQVGAFRASTFLSRRGFPR